MAKPAAKVAGKRAAPPKARGGGGFNRFMLLIIAVGMVPFSLPTITYLFFAMLPTLVAALVDRGPHRYTWLCVGGLNFAGATPGLFELWFGGHTIDLAMVQLTDVVNELLIFGAAAMGWLIYTATPPVVGAFLAMAAQRRVAVLKAQQKRLVELWGEDVKGG